MKKYILFAVIAGLAAYLSDRAVINLTRWTYKPVKEAYQEFQESALRNLMNSGLQPQQFKRDLQTTNETAGETFRRLEKQWLSRWGWLNVINKYYLAPIFVFAITFLLLKKLKFRNI